MTSQRLTQWYRIAQTADSDALHAALAEDAVFHSPVVHTPQRGRHKVYLYLGAAFQVLNNDAFHYVREVENATDAVLEFETEIDGIIINGVDIIRWNSDGQIVDFKVMIRPLKAINLIHQRMASMLESMQN